MSEDKITNGQIQIADEVIGVIAVTAALEVDGVTEGAGSGKGFVEFFGKKSQTKCAKVESDGDEVILDMEIIVNFGTKVQVVAEEVQKRVKNAVETMTGLSVPVVNVAVAGIVKEKNAKADEEEKINEAFEAAAEAVEEAILNSMVTAKEKRGLDGARYRSLAEFLEIPGFLK